MQAVDDYLNSIATPEREVLSHIRNLVRELAPDAEEAISYGMPAFKYQKKYLIGYFAFKDHMSVFPGPNAITNAEEKLKGFKTSKGTIQFTLERPLPDAIIHELIANRIADITKS